MRSPRSNPERRKIAVVSLSLAADRAPLFSQLEKMLQDQDIEVRLAVVEGLQEMKSKPAIAALHTALGDSTPEVSFAAAKALWALNDPAGKQALLSVLSGENKTSSGFFSKQKRQAIRMMHTPRTTIPHMARQGAGFRALVPVDWAWASSSMQQILTDPSGSQDGATAALLLAKDKDKETLDALLDALLDKDFRVRAAAVHSLALRDDPSLRPDLGSDDCADPNEAALRLRGSGCCCGSRRFLR